MSKQKFQIGDEVITKTKTHSGTIIRIHDTIHNDGKKRKVYVVQDQNGLTKSWWSYELVFADLHALAEHCRKELKQTDKDLYSEEACKMYKHGFDDYNAHLAPRKCKYCGEEFDDDLTTESADEPGVCEWCDKHRKKMPKIHNRKSIAVDLKDFSIFGKDGDWLEVTEWTNGEGIDIDIHYASDHEEDNRRFMLSYDELDVIMNIVNKFGWKTVIYTDTKE